MYAKYLSSSTAQFEAYRRISGSKIIDTQLAVRLNNSRLIHGRAYFRPEVVSDIKVRQTKSINSYCYRIETMSRTLFHIDSFSQQNSEYYNDLHYGSFHFR